MIITVIDCLKCKGCEHPEKDLIKHPYEVLIVNDRTDKSRMIKVSAPSASFVPSCLNIKYPERIVKIRKAGSNNGNHV